MRVYVLQCEYVYIIIWLFSILLIFFLYSLEFWPEERVGLLRCPIRRWVKRAFQCFELGRENHKFQREFNVELHGTDDDRELMARYNARREASGVAEFDRNVERLHEAVQEV